MADAATAVPLRVAPDVIVRRVEFGRMETTADGSDRFMPTTQLPAEDGAGFGWVLKVETRRASLHWQERLRLPAPPEDWGDAGDDPDIVISKDGRSALARGEDMVENGELSRFYWTLAEGDPAGDYELDLAVEGHPVAHVVFHVPTRVHEKPILVRAPTGRRGPLLAASMLWPAAELQPWK